MPGLERNVKEAERVGKAAMPGRFTLTDIVSSFAEPRGRMVGIRQIILVRGNG